MGFAVELPTGIALQFSASRQTALVAVNEPGDYTLRFHP
jgi:hypothetical protein